MQGAGDNHGMFEGLEEFGLQNIENKPLYQDEDDEKEKHPGPASEKNNEAKYLFDSEVGCPVCNSRVTVKRIRRSALRLVSRDTDSMPHYQDINPLFYEIWICNNCGYAATQSSFTQPLTQAEAELIRQHISSKWRPKQYPPFYDAHIAVERFKLALVSATVRKARPIDIAMLCLKMGWVYRTMEDTDNEIKCLNQALIGLKSAYDKGPFPAAGMDESTLAFLIGELSRRVGNYQEALHYLGRVITDRTAKSALKEKARDQRQLIINAQRASQSEAAKTQDTPDSTSKTSPPKGLKRLFSKNK
ncbi:MAG: DUF2225 domain-containing protein [Syntrophomonadaceae bacterium]|nr:DUF2225 domain-containing protein [Syntrophomonadaceae bacterium]